MALTIYEITESYILNAYNHITFGEEKRKTKFVSAQIDTAIYNVE